MRTLAGGNTSESLAHTRHIQPIHASLGEAEALIEILSSEQHALMVCNGGTLAELITDKQLRVANLSALNRQLREATTQAGAPTREADLSRFLADCDSTEELVAQWQTLIQLLRYARL